MSNDVVSGTLSLFSKEVKVLFNPGATHSFITCFFRSLCWCPYQASKSSFVNYYSYWWLHVSRLCLHVLCDSLCEKEFLMDLIPVEMYDFDLILGIDWLRPYYTSVDCSVNEIVFRLPSEEEFHFHGNLRVIEA